MSWHGWSVQPPLLYVAVAGMLYYAGGIGYRSSGRHRLRAASFAAGWKALDQLIRHR